MEQLIEKLATHGIGGVIAAITLYLLHQAHRDKAELAEQVRKDQNEVLKELRDVLIRHTEANTILAERIAELPDRLCLMRQTIK